MANNALQARYVPSDQDEQAAQARAARLFEISKVLDDSAFQWFVSALCRLNAEMVGIPISESGDMLAALDMTSKSALGREGGEEDEKSASSKQPKRTGINVIRTLVSAGDIHCF